MNEAMEKERNIEIQIRCVSCGKGYSLYVNSEDWEEYYNSDNRRYIQDIFPYLTPDERELLMSHICSDCWEEVFKDLEP